MWCLRYEIKNDELTRGKSPPAVCPPSVRWLLAAAAQRETQLSGLGVYSRWSCDVISNKNSYLSLTTMHGRSECQLTRYDNIYVIIEQLVETFLAFGCLASASLLHAHSTAGETPPDNVMIVHTDSFWKDNNQWGQSCDSPTSCEFWLLTHSLTQGRMYSLCCVQPKTAEHSPSTLGCGPPAGHTVHTSLTVWICFCVATPC